MQHGGTIGIMLSVKKMKVKIKISTLNGVFLWANLGRRNLWQRIKVK